MVNIIGLLTRQKIQSWHLGLNIKSSLSGPNIWKMINVSTQNESSFLQISF